MAAINGQFDMAMLLLERGADPNLAANGQRRDAALGGDQHAVAAAHALPAAAGDGAAEGHLPRRDEGAAREGRRPQCAVAPASLVHGLQRLRQPQLRPRRHLGLHRLLARGLRHRRRRDAAARRARRRSQHPDDRAAPAGAARPRGRRARLGRLDRGPHGGRGAGAGARSRTAARAPRPCTPPPASNTAKASPATPIATRPTLAAGGEVPRRGARRSTSTRATTTATRRCITPRRAATTT